MRTELYINNQRVEIKEEIGVSLNLAISDIKNPDKRNYSFSRSVELPGTPTLNRLFGHLFDYTEIQNTSTTNFNPDYNPNLKATAVVFCDLVEQFRGYVRLKSIRRENQDLGKITYVVELFGELGNIITNLGTALMSELDLSEYDHTYNRANQKASWSVIHPSGGYYYPMIQYGSNDGVNWNVNDFYPAVYEKVYWDKIMAYAGYTYDSPFINGSLFSKFVIPFTGESFQLSQSQVTNRLFNANTNSAFTALDTSTWSTLTEPFLYNNEVSDPDGQYDPSTGYFTCASPGYYEFKLTGTFYWSAVGGNWSGASQNQLVLAVYHQRGSTIQAINYQTVYNNQASLTAGNSSASVSFTYTTGTIQCNSGDLVWVKLEPRFIGTITGGQYAQFNLNSGASFSNTVSNASIVEGWPISLNSAIPRDIKMVDYFMSVIKDFNLMVEPDRTHPAKVYIDTADDFYGSGTIRNWSHIRDVNKPVELAPMGALDARRYILQGTPGEDRFNKLYTQEYAETYGMRKHDVTNDFLKNDNVYTSIFTPSVLVGRNSDDRVYPEIYALDNAGNRIRVKSGIRRLYAGGAISTSQSWNYVTASATFTETTYPYAGHLDSVSSPTIDLNYYGPRKLYYSAVTYTDGNLWNRYHKKYIDEITDRNSKILTAYFYLKPLDIARLSFRDPIFIDNQYFRLQRVFDYNPSSSKSTKCELLLIKTKPIFEPRTFAISNYLNSTDGIPSERDDTSSGLDGVNAYVGFDNRSGTGTSGNVVAGYRITVGNNAQRNMVAGSSGVDIYPEINSAVVIGSDNITVKNSGEVWIGGVRYARSTDIQVITASTTITNPGIYYCNGTFTVTLDDDIGNGGLVTIKNIGTGTITISGGGLNIDDTATKSLSVQWSSYNIRYNEANTKYFIE